MKDKEQSKPGKYRGELRTRFNNIEQWDGKRWREPPEVGRYGRSLAPTILRFDVEDALPNDDDADHVFRPR